MSKVVEGLRYTKSHEWVRVDGDVATIGITDHAQDQLGDVVFVQLPEAGEAFGKGDSFGVVESVKAVSDLYAPVGGEIEEANDALNDAPELVNSDCYGEGWMIRVKADGLEEALADALDAAGYQAYIQAEG